MAKPNLELFTTPHQRGRNRDSKWREFFGSMKMKEVKQLPDELQEKKSLHGYVPTDIRPEFVFRTNPEDGKRYVARLPEDMRPKRKPQNGRTAPKTGQVVAKVTTEDDDEDDDQQKPVTMKVPGKAPSPPKQFDSD